MVLSYPRLSGLVIVGGEVVRCYRDNVGDVYRCKETIATGFSFGKTESRDNFAATVSRVWSVGKLATGTAVAFLSECLEVSTGPVAKWH